MTYIDNVLFIIILILGIGYFTKNVKKLIRNIKLGKSLNLTNNKPQRLKNMALIAFGQSKMVQRPIAGILHLIVYIGFIIINIEVLEIIIDGIFGTHRIGLKILPKSIYGFLIGTFEVLAVLVIIAVSLFWTRRNLIKLNRFWKSEMTSWPKNDANIILYIEIVLMALFLTMNATDITFQNNSSGNIISQYIAPLFSNLSKHPTHHRKKHLVATYNRHITISKLPLLFKTPTHTISISKHLLWFCITKRAI